MCFIMELLDYWFKKCVLNYETFMVLDFPDMDGEVACGALRAWATTAGGVEITVAVGAMVAAYFTDNTPKNHQTCECLFDVSGGRSETKQTAFFAMSLYNLLSIVDMY